MIERDAHQLISAKKEFLIHLKNHIVAMMNARKEINKFSWILQKNLYENKCITVCHGVKELFDFNGNSFYNTSSTVKHVQAVQLLVKCLEKYKPHQHLENAFTVWNSCLVPTVFKISESTERQKFSRHGKLLVACLLDSDEYTKAIICLGHVAQLYKEDIPCKSLLTNWLCFLGHWSLAKTYLLQEKDVQEMGSVHKDIINKVIEEIICLHVDETNHASCDSSSQHKNTLDNMRCFEDILAKSKTKTYQQYEAQILVKRVLLLASHFSCADLKNIGDPLQNMDIIKARYETLVKCRSIAFFGDEMKKKDANDITFDGLFLGVVKLNSVLAEYFNTVIKLCFKYTEFGILREGESEGLKLFYQVLKAANLQRCLAALNLLLLTSTVTHKDNLNGNPGPFRPIVACIWNVSYSVVTRNAFNKIELEEHEQNCNCVVCTLCRMRPQMRIEAVFSNMLYHQYSSKIFRLFCRRIQELPQETVADIISMCSVLQIRATNKVVSERKYPLDALERFLTATIRWLRRVRQLEKAEIVQDVIKESLKWLTIRQLARKPLEIPNLYWLCPDKQLTGGLRSPLKSVAMNLASHFNTLAICSLKPSGNINKTTSIGKSKHVHNSTTQITVSYVDVEVEEARKDFSSFSHLFYREWRFHICSYLGLLSAFPSKADWVSSGWSAAYYFNEAMSVSTRQLARMISDKSIENPVFHYENHEKFKEAVRSLPFDLTVVQLFLDSSRILWLIKLFSHRSPLVIPIASILQDNPILERFSALLLENDASGNLSKTCIGPKEYWVIRKKLDKKLEYEWFGIFCYLLLPSVVLSSVHISVVKQMQGFGFSESSAIALVENLDLSGDSWRELVERFSVLENINETVIADVISSRNRCISKHGRGSFSRNYSDSYVLFCVSPELASFPFELLPVIESHKRVCRISSFHMLQKLLSCSKKIPKSVDGRNSFYVLDPGGDLTDTQMRLSKKLEKFTCWRGTVGIAPKPEELRAFLEKSDIYMGHGSGGKYFGRSTVLRSNIRAVSLLMGCSSVRIIHEGEGFDGRGAIHDYVIAKCPCVVGCLWMVFKVTDGEIDRVLLALLDFCFSEIEKQNEKKTSPSYRLLIDGIAYARTACKLKYMTGGAVVAYGLPIVTHLTNDMVTMNEECNRNVDLKEDGASSSK
ncbi:unnamed protein product [Thelazia callipaeda]|uniref:separase n=1 Tax=Thelazia callipaeda TaxID=103827 RepID=A0A158RCI6_THECL|nr:unnamed protein product [Thelazia callipaeda]